MATAAKARQLTLGSFNPFINLLGDIPRRLNKPRAKNDPMGIAVLAAAGVMRTTIAEVTPTLQRKWWRKPYPVFWRYIWAKHGILHGKSGKGFRGIYKIYSKGVKIRSKSGNVFYNKKRPTRVLKNNVKVKLSRLSYVSPYTKVSRVYVRFNRKASMWSPNNAWFAKFVEFGTKASARPTVVDSGSVRSVKQRKMRFHPKATVAYHFFDRGLRGSRYAALKKFDDKMNVYILQEFTKKR